MELDSFEKKEFQEVDRLGRRLGRWTVIVVAYGLLMLVGNELLQYDVIQTTLVVKQTILGITIAILAAVLAAIFIVYLQFRKKTNAAMRESMKSDRS